LPGDALVVRFAPSTPENVLKRLERDARRSDTDQHLASVFVGTRKTPDESDDEVLARVLRATETDFTPESNPNFFVCARAEALQAQDFGFVKDGYAGEIPEHFSVDFGTSPTLEDVERFLGTFERRRRKAA
jgi:hypothetical protein